MLINLLLLVMFRYLLYLRCSVTGCRFNGTSTKVKLFRFPQPVRNNEILAAIHRQRYKIWAQLANNPCLDQEKMTAAYMCSVHFEQNQFYDDARTRLIRGAVPRLRPGVCPENIKRQVKLKSVVSSARSKLMKRNAKQTSSRSSAKVKSSRKEKITFRLLKLSKTNFSNICELHLKKKQLVTVLKKQLLLQKKIRGKCKKSKVKERRSALK